MNETIKKEWLSIIKNKAFLLIVGVLLFIPIMYAGFFLKSVWDPYGNTDKLPVAVVNLDKSPQFNGQTLQLGKDIENELKGNKNLQWNFVSKETAEKGLEDKKYYMILTIPEDFSQNAATVLSDTPKKIQLDYETNGSLNYIGEVINKTAMNQLQGKVSEEVTSAYVSAIFDKIKTMSTGLQQAATGATTLNEGTGKTMDGNQQIATNLGKLASSSLTLSAGTDSLNKGLGQYVAGVVQIDNGAASLKEGLSQLSNQVPMLTSSVSQLNQGTQTVNQGMSQYTTGVSSLNQGATQLVQNNANLNAGATQLSSGVAQLNQEFSGMLDGLAGNSANIEQLYQGTVSVNQVVSTLSTGSQQVEAGVTQLATSLGNLPDVSQISTLTSQLDPSTFSQLSEEEQQAILSQASASLTQLAGGITAMKNQEPQVTSLAQGATAVHEGLTNMEAQTPTLVQGMDQLNTTFTNLSTNKESYQQKLQQLQDGAMTLTTSISSYTSGTNEVAQTIDTLDTKGQELKAGTESLAEGTNKIQQAMPNLTSGIGQLESGSTTLNQGTKTLVTNSSTLTNGSAQLVSGGIQLADGSGQLYVATTQLSDGLSQLNQGSGELAAKLGEGAKEISAVPLGEKTVSQIAEPATLKHTEYSHVPNYGHALAPYVMSMALFMGCLVFNMIYPVRRRQNKEASAFSWWGSKISVALFASIAMALIEGTIMIGLGLQVESFGQYYAMITIAGIAFMLFVTTLGILFDNIGRFVSLIMLVLQLAASGGTFPMPITGHFFNVIHSFMPMTYSINGLRQAITGGLGFETFMTSYLILLTLGLVSAGVLYFGMAQLTRVYRQGSQFLSKHQLFQNLLNIREGKNGEGE